MPRINDPTGDPLLDRLRTERERRGWSLQHTAELLHRSSYQAVHNYEQGRASITLANLRAWAALFDLEVTLTRRRSPADGDTPAVRLTNGA